MQHIRGPENAGILQRFSASGAGVPRDSSGGIRVKPCGMCAITPKCAQVPAVPSGQRLLAGRPSRVSAPDGELLAFASNRDGDFDVYVVHADGSELVQLTNEDARDIQPVFSPSGTRIAFGSEDALSGMALNISLVPEPFNA